MHAHDVACIVLAAGGSTRFGARKLLQELGGESLAHRAVRAAIECNTKAVIAVIGADADAVGESISDYSSVVTVLNEKWESGLSSSIVAGLRALEQIQPVDGVMITLADQPLVDSFCLLRLLDEFDSGQRIVASQYNGVVGAPAVIGAEHVPDLMQLEGDRGAGAWLKQRLSSLVSIPIPEAAADIDTADDLERVKAELARD